LSKIALSGNASGTGTLTIAAPNTSTDRTLTLPDNTGTIVTTGSSPSFPSTIGVGGATPAASGAGITFPGTASASSDANTLDDYEEGTFTPVVADATTGGNTATGSFDGTYTKVGNVVSIGIQLLNINTTGMTGANILYIRNMPFTALAGSSAYVGSCIFDRITFSGFVTSYLPPNSSYLDFRENVSNAQDVTLIVSDVNVSGGSDIFVSVTYLAA
jgi:hypothetical protein